MKYFKILKTCIKIILGASTLGIGIKLTHLIITHSQQYTPIPYALDTSALMLTGIYVLATTIKQAMKQD